MSRYSRRGVIGSIIGITTLTKRLVDPEAATVRQIRSDHTAKPLFAPADVCLQCRRVLDTTNILHAAGLRRTPVRSAIIDLLGKARRPQSVQDLIASMPKGTDVVTIYRTLNTLVKKKLARRIRSEDRSWHFEIAVARKEAEHVHAHFVCDTCGTVECLPDVAVPSLTPPSVELDKGYEVKKQDLTLHGTCPKCH